MADHYFAVTGSGSGTGADADNPQTYSATNNSTAKSNAVDGDTIFFLDGDYNFLPNFSETTAGKNLTFKSLNIVKELGDTLENWNYEKLNETDKISGYIKDKLKNYDFS